MAQYPTDTRCFQRPVFLYFRYIAFLYPNQKIIVNSIVPQTIRKSVRKVLEISHSAEEEKTTAHRKLTDAEREATIRRLEKEMKEASKMLEFEYAALLRDQIIELRGEK